MNEDNILYYAVGAIAFLLLAGWYWRAVHEIAKRNRFMVAQIKLLSKIAEKSGVPQEEIQAIQKEVG